MGHECPYDIIKCGKNCGKKYERQKENEHNIFCTERIVSCNNCDLEGTYNNIKKHKQKCKIIKCINCTIKFKKEKYDLHLDNCELFLYNCKFTNCTFKSNLDKLQYHIISKHKYPKFIDTGIYKNKEDKLFIKENKINGIINNETIINKLKNGEYSSNDTQLLINIEKEYLTNIQ